MGSYPFAFCVAYFSSVHPENIRHEVSGPHRIPSDPVILLGIEIGTRTACGEQKKKKIKHTHVISFPSLCGQSCMYSATGQEPEIQSQLLLLTD